MSTMSRDIIDLFVTNFISKSKRERSLFELTKKRAAFTNKLNHQLLELFEVSQLIRLDSSDQGFVAAQLKASSKTPCYIISNDALDDTIIEFDTAFEKLVGNGLGFCIVPMHGNVIYTEGEQIFGSSVRYISIRQGV